MNIEFDRRKSDRNEATRGLPFSMVSDLDWESATFVRDERFPYPEPRFVGFGLVGERLHFLCFTPTEGGIRVISFRKANKKEIRRYEQETG